MPSGVSLLSIELSFALFNTSNWAGDQWRLYLLDNGTTREWKTITESNSGSGFGVTQFFKWYIQNPTAGSHLYKIQIGRTNGSGTGATNADANSPIEMKVQIEG